VFVSQEGRWGTSGRQEGVVGQVRVTRYATIHPTRTMWRIRARQRPVTRRNATKPAVRRKRGECLVLQRRTAWIWYR